MSSINGISNVTDPSLQNASQTSSSHGKITDTLDSLVNSGAITQNQESAVQNALTTALQSNSSQVSTSGSTAANPLSSLVSSGTITQSQANTIESALKGGHHHHHHTQAVTDTTDSSDVDPLTGLVSSATSSSSQSPTFIQTLQNELQAQMSSSDNSQTDQSLFQGLIGTTNDIL